MEKMRLRDVKAMAEAVAAVAVLIATLTIVGELWHPLKDTLKLVFTHHWLGKGVLSIVLFATVYWLRKDNPARNGSAVRAMYWAVALSWIATTAMMIFFTLHFYHIV